MKTLVSTKHRPVIRFLAIPLPAARIACLFSPKPLQLGEGLVGIVTSKGGQIIPNHLVQGRSSLLRELPGPVESLIVDRERHIHEHRIRARGSTVKRRRV